MIYHAPATLDDAMALMAVGEVQVVAGGTDYFPARGRDPQQRDLLDVTGIAEMRGITRDSGRIRIGGATTWSEIARADLPASCAGLQAAAREVGSLQIQNAGTVAGNLCNASPAADGVPPLLTLDAVVELRGPNGLRHLALDQFLQGPRQTACAPGELLAAIWITPPAVPARGAFAKLGSRKYLVISFVMTAVVLTTDAGGVVTDARIAVGACSPVAQRLTQLERDCLGQQWRDISVTPAHLAGLSPITDVRADAAYRLQAAQVQIRRAIAQAGGVA
jgi:CO/xanthine dehydrogenase FAD-binding subunit